MAEAKKTLNGVSHTSISQQHDLVQRSQLNVRQRHQITSLETPLHELRQKAGRAHVDVEDDRERIDTLTLS